MKKNLSIIFFVLVLATLLSACGTKAPTLGEALVTISGKITELNNDETYVLDQAAFEAKSVELIYNDPYMGSGLKYKGILLRDLIEMVGANNANTIHLFSTADQNVDIPVADAQEWDIMLARWVDGVLLDPDIGGPVKLVFPDDAKDTYPDAQWAWWISGIEFK